MAETQDDGTLSEHPTGQVVIEWSIKSLIVDESRGCASWRIGTDVISEIVTLMGPRFMTSLHRFKMTSSLLRKKILISPHCRRNQ